MAQWVKYLTAVTQVTMKVGVSSPAWCSVLKDPALLQLWWRLQMWLRFQSLVQELPYAHVCGPKKKKKKKNPCLVTDSGNCTGWLSKQRVKPLYCSCLMNSRKLPKGKHTEHLDAIMIEKPSLKS